VRRRHKARLDRRLKFTAEQQRQNLKKYTMASAFSSRHVSI